MTDTKQHVDVAVIDEVQLLADISRGWAWTRALLGVPAEEIHVCGEPSVEGLIRKLCADTGDLVDVQRYERLSPLHVQRRALYDLKNVRPGDCLIAFSRRELYRIKRAVEQQTNGRVRCCLVYGSLPPEARREQARLFNEEDNGFDVLVASDAVGMGLNLNIGRVVFTAMQKFDGIQVRPLTVAEVKQIAGRAGRYKSKYPEGSVTCLHARDMGMLHKRMGQEVPARVRAGVLPETDHLLVYARERLVEQRQRDEETARATVERLERKQRKGNPLNKKEKVILRQAQDRSASNFFQRARVKNYAHLKFTAILEDFLDKVELHMRLGEGGEAAPAVGTGTGPEDAEDEESEGEGEDEFTWDDDGDEDVEDDEDEDEDDYEDEEGEGDHGMSSHLWVDDDDQQSVLARLAGRGAGRGNGKAKKKKKSHYFLCDANDMLEIAYLLEAVGYMSIEDEERWADEEDDGDESRGFEWECTHDEEGEDGEEDGEEERQEGGFSHGLSLRDRATFTLAPADVSLHVVALSLRRFATLHAKGLPVDLRAIASPMPLEELVQLPLPLPPSDGDDDENDGRENRSAAAAAAAALPPPATAKAIDELEELHKAVDVYLWLAHRLPESFVELEHAQAVRVQLSKMIEAGLMDMGTSERRQRAKMRAMRQKAREQMRREIMRGAAGGEWSKGKKGRKKKGKKGGGSRDIGGVDFVDMGEMDMQVLESVGARPLKGSKKKGRKKGKKKAQRAASRWE